MVGWDNHDTRQKKKDSWTPFLMGFAHHAATKSKDSTKVGAVLVGENKEVLLTSYNGLPIGVSDLHERYQRPIKYLYCAHAESNLIAFAARNGIATNGKTVYTTHYPCSSCARTLIQAGIKCVVVGDGLTNMPQQEFDVAKEMFNESGVEVYGMENN